MSRSADFDDDEDRDDPQEIDQDWAAAEDEQDDVDDTIECPQCGKQLHWSAPRCPACGTWLTGSDSPVSQRSRRWLWPITVAILIAIILVLWNGFR